MVSRNSWNLGLDFQEIGNWIWNSWKRGLEFLEIGNVVWNSWNLRLEFVEIVAISRNSKDDFHEFLLFFLGFLVGNYPG